MTYNDVLELVRDKFPNWLIRTVYKFENEYHFHISPGSYFSVDDLAVMMLIVNEQTGKITSYGTGEFVWKVLMNASEDYTKRFDEAIESMKPVDLTTEQWNECLKLKQHDLKEKRVG